MFFVRRRNTRGQAGRSAAVAVGRMPMSSPRRCAQALRASCAAALAAGAILSAKPLLAQDSNSVAELAGLIQRAVERHKPLPLVSAYAGALSEEQAYAIQRGYVALRLRDDAILGYKAALTAGAQQKLFKMTHPVSGVLFRGGVVSPPQHVRLGSARRLMIETEVALVVGTPITAPLRDVDALRAHIRMVAPAVELPELGFADAQALTAADLIAANVGAHQVIVGSPAVQGVGWLPPLKDVRVSLKLNGVVVSEGQGSDVAGDPWQAGFWLANRVVKQGAKIEMGQVLYTGAMGKMTAATNGVYIADYGTLGMIRFEVE